MLCFVDLRLGIILVNDQLDAQFFFRISLFQISTCFEHSCAHHQENQLYQYDIWYISLYVGDRLVFRFGFHPNLHTRRSPTQSDIYIYIYIYISDVVLIQLILLMMSTLVLETCRDLE